MYLKTLTVKTSGRDVRRVPFRRGLNLIVDETAPDKREASGNNVGKTTALRCVDYCLEADAKSLYFDREWSMPNEKVLTFLEEKRPTFVLELESVNGHPYVISRTYGENTRLLNGAPFPAAAAKKELRSVLFRVQGPKPTLRQLLAKFIRLSVESRHYTMRWLHSTTPDADYDILWLTLFGFPMTAVLNARREAQKLVLGLDRRSKEITAVARSPRQERKIIERDLAEATRLLQNLAVADAQEKDLDRLRVLRRSMADLGQQLAEAEGHVANGERTLQQLQQAVPRIGHGTIREVFEDAEKFIEDLHVTYEQLVGFHDAMLRNKAAFTRRVLARRQAEARQLRQRLHDLGDEEALLLKSFASVDIAADVRRLNDEVVRLSKRQGYLEGLEQELAEIDAQLKQQKAAILGAESAIEASREGMEAHLEEFNQFFSAFSRRLYDRSYYLALRLHEGKRGHYKVVPSITNTEGNEGAGTKRSEIAAFDLAYLRWQEKRKSKTVRFTLHDEVELIHGHQLATLFEIAEGIDGQFVVPILSDRLSTVPFERAKECTVLRLSEGNRFFGIP